MVKYKRLLGQLTNMNLLQSDLYQIISQEITNWLSLKHTWMNQLSRAKTGVNLTLSYAPIKHNNGIVSSVRKKYNGGFIPLLASTPIIASAPRATRGLAGGIASAKSASNNAKAAAAAQAELETPSRSWISVEGRIRSHIRPCSALQVSFIYGAIINRHIYITLHYM